MAHNQGYEVTIDGVSSTTIPEYICERVTRKLVGDRRHTVELVPGREGGWLIPEQPGMRQITIVSHVLADTFPTGRRDAIREVANWADQQTHVKLILGDDPNVFHWAVLQDNPDIDEWRERGSFDLVFNALPYAESINIQEHIEVSATSSKTFNVVVDGDVFTRPTIEIVPTGATSAVAVTIAGRTLTHTAALATLVKRTVNCLARVVEVGGNTDTDLTGEFNPALLSMPGVTGTFPYLSPGTNSVQIVCTGATGFTATLKWRDRYR